MEGCQTDKHLVEHDAERPSVHLLTIAALLEQLRARVEGRPTDAQLGIRAIKDR